MPPGRNSESFYRVAVQVVAAAVVSCVLVAGASADDTEWPPDLLEHDTSPFLPLEDLKAAETQAIEADHELIPTEAPDSEIVPQSLVAPASPAASPIWLNATWNNGLEPRMTVIQVPAFCSPTGVAKSPR